jgi:hypothetical protein
MTPGPGKYQTMNNGTSCSVVIGTTPKEDLWIPKDKIDTPGPASYELPVGIIPRKLSIGEKLDRKIELSPGPGDYNVEAAVTAKTPRAPAIKIGTTKRVEIFVGRDDEPGPALYSCIEDSKKNHGPTFGMKPKEKT